MAYSVITPTGAIRPASALGIARNLAHARRIARPGDTIQQWGKAGQPRSSWAVGANGTLRKRIAR